MTSSCWGSRSAGHWTGRSRIPVLVISDRSGRLQQRQPVRLLVEQGPSSMPCHAFSALVYTRSQGRTLVPLVVRPSAPRFDSFGLTNAMGTWVLAITLCAQLVALVTSPTDPSPNGPGCHRGSSGRAVGVLPVFRLWPGSSEMGVVDSYMLLQRLESIVRALGKGVHPASLEMARRDMPVGEQSRRRERVVRGKAMKRI